MDVSKKGLKKYASKYDLVFFSWVDVMQSGNPRGMRLAGNAVPALFKKGKGFNYQDMSKRMRVHEQLYHRTIGNVGRPELLKNNPPNWLRTKHFYMHVRYLNKNQNMKGGSFLIHPMLFKPFYWKGSTGIPPYAMNNPRFKHLEKKKKDDISNRRA